ncbi:MAG: regulatory protein RecX [Peptococcaceae bacterium]|nr:regulatory protein RecX [Peptococcaceae bacterium]
MEEKHKQLALRYLTVRMRSEYEMRQYLRRKQVSDEEANEIIDYLYSYHYLDDRQFAESYIRDKLRFNPCGRLKLIMALKDKGIDAFIIEDALASEYPEDVEMAQLEKEYNKCREKGKKYQQTMRYLYGKGYSAGMLSFLERY